MSGSYAEGGRVVDDHASRLRGDGGKLLADAPPGGEEPDLDAPEGILLEHLDGIGFPLEFEFLPQGALRGKQGQFAHGEIAFLEDADHFISDGAGGANNGYTVLSHEIRLLHLNGLLPGSTERASRDRACFRSRCHPGFRFRFDLPAWRRLLFPRAEHALDQPQDPPDGA